MQPPASALLVADKIVGSNGWKIGDRVQFECAPGHVLVGAVDSVCQADVTWSSSYTDCVCTKADQNSGSLIFLLENLHDVVFNPISRISFQKSYFVLLENS